MKKVFKRVQGSPAGERGVPARITIFPFLEEGGRGMVGPNRKITFIICSVDANLVFART
jgi:hypothetical protein